MIPASMSVSNAVSNERSIVHHQAANRVRSSRETIETSSGTALDQWCLALVDGGLTRATRNGLAFVFSIGGATLQRAGVRPGRASTSSRNLSPRISKLRYWSNEAHAGD